MTINKVITEAKKMGMPTKSYTRKHRREKIAQAIKMLNDVVKAKLAPSPIHGVGIFALTDIKKGTRLYLDALPQILDVPYKDFNKLYPEVREVILERWPLIKNGSHFLYPETMMMCYMNHSDQANYDAKKGKTLKNIYKGEEITEDYRKIEGFDKIFPWIKKDVV